MIGDDDMRHLLQMTDLINDNVIDSEIQSLICLMESYTKQYEMNTYIMEESSSNKEGILTKIWNTIKSIFQLIGKCLKSIFQKFSKPNQYAKKVNHIVEHTDPDKMKKMLEYMQDPDFAKAIEAAYQQKHLTKTEQVNESAIIKIPDHLSTVQQYGMLSNAANVGTRGVNHFKNAHRKGEAAARTMSDAIMTFGRYSANIIMWSSPAITANIITYIPVVIGLDLAFKVLGTALNDVNERVSRTPPNISQLSNVEADYFTRCKALLKNIAGGKIPDEEVVNEAFNTSSPMTLNSITRDSETTKAVRNKLKYWHNSLKKHGFKNDKTLGLEDSNKHKKQLVDDIAVCLKIMNADCSDDRVMNHFINQSKSLNKEIQKIIKVLNDPDSKINQSIDKNDKSQNRLLNIINNFAKMVLGFINKVKDMFTIFTYMSPLVSHYAQLTSNVADKLEKGDKND